MAFQGIFQFILVVATYMDGACIVIPTGSVPMDFIFSFFFPLSPPQFVHCP
jgi:hypothetical protein